MDKEKIKVIKQIRKGLSENNYEVVHCHTLIAAMCTRLGCRPLRRDGVKVFWSVRGFHFYQGVSSLLKNWLIYYPIENYVLFLGYRIDISELCRATDVYVLPSLQEGIPIASMEAIAYRTPIVCFQIRGNIDFKENLVEF